ncbi:hypothetical protein DdX_21643 [Ditylenchus destructor]|uniref:Uncharacterized protein n=1 Tax=Ditylenchus destructor TaxID=166010 RepID=A0AAD4MEL7_9BILA|nr:hypothetical protein DdX_21643 [Ditylenchus destructor]
MSLNSVVVLLMLTVAVNIRILLPQQYYDFGDEETACNMSEINTTTCNDDTEICTLKVRKEDECIWWNSSQSIGQMTAMLLRENSGTCKEKCLLTIAPAMKG